MIGGEAAEENFVPCLLSAAAMMDAHSWSGAFMAVGHVPDTGQVLARPYGVETVVWMSRLLSRPHHER